MPGERAAAARRPRRNSSFAAPPRRFLTRAHHCPLLVALPPQPVVDLLHPDVKKEKKLHKKKRLVQGPNSYFMDVRCPSCYQITTVFSHATTVVQCGACAILLCQPTGGKCRLTEGCSFRRKPES